MRVGVDLDGVIVDSIRYWIRVLNREAGTCFGPDDLPDVYDQPALAECCDRHELEMLIAPPPVPGAVSGLRRLKDMGHTIAVVTARAGRLRPLTEAWLLYHGITVDSLHFLDGGQKASVVIAEGLDCHIEDTPHQALAVAGAGVTVILMATPYNGHVEGDGIIRCTGWDDITANVGRLAVSQMALGQ